MSLSFNRLTNGSRKRNRNSDPSRRDDPSIYVRIYSVFEHDVKGRQGKPEYEKDHHQHPNRRHPSLKHFPGVGRFLIRRCNEWGFRSSALFELRHRIRIRRRLKRADRLLFGFPSRKVGHLLVAPEKRALARAHDVSRRDAADRLFCVQQPGALPLWGAWADWVRDLQPV